VTPYYQDANVTLYHGDCLEIDAWLEADVLVTDPPYGTAPGTPGQGNDGYGRRQNHDPKGRFGQRIANDTDVSTRDTALGLWGDRPALVFASPRLPEPPGVWADRLVWDKKRLGMNGGPWRYRHESIYVTDGFERRNNESGSILTAFPDEQALHIHAKPLSLMTALVECAPAGVIADPFAGSGSTLVAAHRLGRTAVGVELDERYCELVASRLAQGCLDFGSAS
jgi:DNA modification methylase